MNRFWLETDSFELLGALDISMMIGMTRRPPMIGAQASSHLFWILAGNSKTQPSEDQNELFLDLHVDICPAPMN